MRTALIPRLSSSAVVTLGDVELHAGTSLALVLAHPQGRARAGIDLHALLRSLLGRLAGRPAESIRLERSEAGKPSLAGGPIAFNLSHAGGHSLIALSLGGDIGCDIEDRFSDEEPMALAAPVLHACELDEMARLTPRERHHAFRRYWVRKESVLKAAGSGFLRDPRLVVTGLAQPHPTWMGEPGPAFFIHELEVEPGCVAAVAGMDAACSWRRLAG